MELTLAQIQGKVELLTEKTQILERALKNSTELLETVSSIYQENLLRNRDLRKEAYKTLQTQKKIHADDLKMLQEDRTRLREWKEKFQKAQEEYKKDILGGT